MNEIKHNFFVDNYADPVGENGIPRKHLIVLAMNLKN